MRAGYANFDSLKMMTQKKILKGLSSITHPNQLREGCLVGKQFPKSFLKKSTSRASQHLQKIHANVCGYIQSCSFYKNLYFFYFLLMIIVEQHEYVFLK
jgi:hypothetical protein